MQLNDYTVNLGEFKLDLQDGKWASQGLRAYIAGISGSGKTNLVAVWVEELARLGVPFVVIDPMGDYFTLTELGQVAVVSQGGDIDMSYPAHDWVDAAMQRYRAGWNVVVDLGGLHSRSDRRVAFVWLVRQLSAYQIKSRLPMFLVVEEAQIFAPQKRMQDIEALEVLEDVARRGRRSGMNLILASQRPRDLEADVATQCNIHFIGKLEDRLDYEAVKYKLDVPRSRRKPARPPAGLKSLRVLQSPEITEVMDLATGCFFVRNGASLLRVKVRRRHTQHVGETPLIQRRLL